MKFGLFGLAMSWNANNSIMIFFTSVVPLGSYMKTLRHQK